MFADLFENIEPSSPFVDQRWEFIKENQNVKKQENTLSTKRAIKKRKKEERKHALDKEKKTIFFS